MSSVIYYFTGTGNSLWVAKKIAKSIEGTKLISISSSIDKEIINSNYDFVGIITPVYYNGLPEIVEIFLKKLKTNKDSYIYSVATLGVSSSNIFTYMDKYLNHNLSYGKHVSMAANYVRMYDAPKEEKLKSLMINADKNLVGIISDIKQKKVVAILQEKGIKTSLLAFVRKIWINKLPNIDKGFKVDSSCTSCGLCEKVCPVNNIKMSNGHPKWNGKCQDCVACINLCPAKSIQIKDRTKNRRRYKNPEIKLSELMNSVDIID